MLGIGLVFLGLMGSLFFIKDTKHHVAKETINEYHTQVEEYILGYNMER